jgi:peptidoglycan/LPS O-acetylase OafA/YrhL
MATLAVVGIAFGYRATAVAWPDSWWAAGMPWPVMRLTEFVIGMGLAWAFRCGWRPRLPAWVGVGAAIGSVLGVAAMPHLVPGSWLSAVTGSFSNEIVIVGCALAIVSLAARRLSGRPSPLAARPLVVLGEWSYAFYLVHATVIYLCLEIFGAQRASWTNLLWYAGVFVLALACAAGLHYLVERPAEKRLRAWKDQRDAARAVPDPA